jgi:hypothetical protein
MYVLDINGVNIVRSTFSIIDTLTLQTIGSGDLPSDSFPRSIFVASPPRPPKSLGALVNGAQVSLAWSVGGAPAAVNRYVLEVGSAPGLSDIFTGLDVGLQTSFGASGVPPGRYYVRVRAGNYTGLGAPSNEVVVTVP